jgi:hypothetical protein
MTSRQRGGLRLRTCRPLFPSDWNDVIYSPALHSSGGCVVHSAVILMKESDGTIRSSCNPQFDFSCFYSNQLSYSSVNLEMTYSIRSRLTWHDRHNNLQHYLFLWIYRLPEWTFSLEHAGSWSWMILLSVLSDRFPLLIQPTSSAPKVRATEESSRKYHSFVVLWQTLQHLRQKMW